MGYLGFTPNSDTGDGGWDVVGYTMQFGNGFSASISAEDRRTTQIIGGGINSHAWWNQLPDGGTFVTWYRTVRAGLSIAPNVGLINGGLVPLR